jgi:hypothetical protein
LIKIERGVLTHASHGGTHARLRQAGSRHNSMQVASILMHTGPSVHRGRPSHHREAAVDAVAMSPMA